MPQRKAREQMLILIVGPIHTNALVLPALHQDFHFQITPLKSQLIRLSCISFFNAHLFYIEIFKDFNISFNRAFKKHRRSKKKCFGGSFAFAVNDINYRYG